MGSLWLKIRSWHVVRTATRVPDRYITVCGRQAVGVPIEDRPGNEATCESCLRIVAPK